MSEAGRTRTTTERGVDLSWDSGEPDSERRAGRDWKRLFLVVGLGLLSWVATYVGMLELIEANMGELPLVHKLIIGFSVAMLMVMVVWLLDQMFSDIGWVTRILFFGGYVFLTIISVGFGFYWKVLESRSEASRSAESAVGQVQTSLHGAMTRLEQLQGTLDSLTAISTQKAETERASGTSCPNSKPGDGPRRKMRDDDAGRFKFAADFVKGRVASVKSDIAALDTDLALITKDDKSTVDARSGTRNEFMRNLGRKLDMTVVGFNAFRSDPQLKQIRIDLNERADKATFIDTKGGTYTCPDTQLTTALRGVVRAIDELPALEKPKIAAVEGSEAVIEAFRRLTATFYGALSFKLPPSPEELRELQKRAVQSVESAAATQAKVNAMAEQAGLSKRDYVPLAIAIFVDLCLLLVSMKKAGGRLDGLVAKMRTAERGPVIQILSRFNEIHRDKQIRENFEVFRHVVFDFHGDYYAAVPLNAPYRPNPANAHQRQGYGVSDAHELLQEAHLLGNLFASFEKERIFTRVHSPLLSTKTVQKRLRRQGSKFANAEAFRLYRFRDGAWSEIILGAVMGAARRVEADKRRRRVEEDMFRATEPALAAEAGVRASPRPDGPPLPAAPAYPYVVGGTAHGSRAVHGGSSAAAMPPPWQPDAQAGDPVHSAPPVPRREAAQAVNGRAGAGRMAPAYSMARAPVPWGATDEARAESSGPARHANNNTVPSARVEIVPAAEAAPAPLPAATVAGENVVLHPAVSRPPAAMPEVVGSLALAPEPAERTVTVAATRETVTYSVPASEVVLPSALLRAPAAIEASVADAAAAVEQPPSAPARIGPPPLPAAVPQEAPAPTAVEPEPRAVDATGAEQDAWQRARAGGFDREQAEALAGQAADVDDPRTIALRLRPERREG